MTYEIESYYLPAPHQVGPYLLALLKSGDSITLLPPKGRDPFICDSFSFCDSLSFNSLNKTGTLTIQGRRRGSSKALEIIITDRRGVKNIYLDPDLFGDIAAALFNCSPR